MFRSLRIHNYRLWAMGALVSNVGTWMQRIAQDWLVLTQLTHNSGAALGVVMALQFAPPIVLLPLTGWAADRFDRRTLLFVTQAASGVLALGLGLLTLLGAVQLWQVYAFALALGVVSAFDAPARQTFVSELVDEAHLSNAVALNSTTFNAARLIGPAVGGVLIAAVGTGWMFVINAASYGATVAALAALRHDQLFRGDRARGTRTGPADGFRYVWREPRLLSIMVMFYMIGTFGLNFAIFISTMTVRVFGGGAHRFGLLTSMMAVGSVVGGLLSARRSRPSARALVGGAASFGVACAMAAVMPEWWLFGLMLAIAGVASQTFTTTANGVVQLSAEPALRGRVVAIMMALAMGGTPIGAPITGWVADTLGPRWSLAVGALAGLAATAVGPGYLIRHRGLRLVWDGRGPRLTMQPRHPATREAVTEGKEAVEEAVLQP